MRGGDLAIRQARDTTTQGRSHTEAIAVTTNNDDKKGAWSGSIFLFPLSFLPVPLRGVRLGGTKSLGLTLPHRRRWTPPSQGHVPREGRGRK